jgi:hypothetical protein
MKISLSQSELETRAREALTETLGRMSGVNLKEIQCASTRSGSPPGFLARVEVFGHYYTLACSVDRHRKPTYLSTTLRDSLGSAAARLMENAIPVVIAPHFSPTTRAACAAADIGYLDLEGNACLTVGDVFISERSFPRSAIAPAIALTPGDGKATTTLQWRAGQQLKTFDNSREQRAIRVCEGELRLRGPLSESGAPLPGALISSDLSQRGGI